MIIDIVIGAVIFVSALISFFRGLIRETLTIAGVIGGIFAALTFAPSLTPTFKSWLGVVEGEPVEKLFKVLPMNIVADVCAYGSLFIGVVIIISLISHFISGAIKATGLGPIDRTLGVVFGIVRAVILLGLVYLPFHLLMSDEAKEQYFGQSRTHIYVEKSASFLANFLPSSKDVTEKVEEAAEGQIKKKLFENNILSTGEDDPTIMDSIIPEDPTITNNDAISDDQNDENGYQVQERKQLDDLLTEPLFNE